MAEINLEAELMKAIRNGIADAVGKHMQGYNSPIEKLLNSAVADQAPTISKLLCDSIGSTLNDTEFREHIGTAVRTKLASTLIQRFGGELEKQVNALKSDPTTRARITLAIEEIVKQHSAKS